MASHGDSQTEDFATRNAAAFFEKFERYDCQELLAYTATHWLLSGDDFKVPTDPPMGLIPNMTNVNEFTSMILVPVEEGGGTLDLREIHQIVKELTYGIYILNQLPNIHLEANFDQSTSVQIPPAYIDTRVGQLLTNVDYMMKALWHGAFFPKEKRTKFSERWRSNLDVNPSGKPETKKPLLTEFTSAGMVDISKDPDLASAYDKLPVEQPGDAEMAEERRFFMTHTDDVSMQMTLFQNSVQQHKNLFVVDSDYLIGSLVHEDKLNSTEYERLNARLQLHEIMLKEHLPKKAEVKQQLYLLKLIGFLVPYLVAMKKRMKIPDINRLLQNMSGDEVKTERELPPLMLSPDFACKNFSFGNHYFHLHGGILIDHETPDLAQADQHFVDSYDSIKSEATSYLLKWCDPSTPLQEAYPLPSTTIDDKEYQILALEFETYYPQSPQKPKWVHSMCEAVSKLRPKRLPIPDMQIHEQFKKYFGYKRAIKYKNLPNGLKGAAQRGLVAMFMTLSRKCPPSRLGKQDEVGLSLMHYAAMYNRPQIIAILILQSMDVNVRRNNNILSTGDEPLSQSQKFGPTPLHLSARCGAFDTAACLVANFANLLATDQDGWAPIHHAAYYNHEQIIKLLVRKNDAMLELQTKNDKRSTPLLLAANAGALQAVKCLITMGAYVLRKDDDGNNVIHLAALRFHTNVLEFFIHYNHPDVPVWELLVGMLKDPDPSKKDPAVKCLEVMSTSGPEYWHDILKAGGIEALVTLLKQDSEIIQSVAASVLCNTSEHEEVRKALSKCNAAPILIQLLNSPVDEIQSRAAIVLSDLACVDDNQGAIAEQGGIPALVNLLDSELEDVLANAVNAIRVMCTNNQANQQAVAKNGGIEPLVEFLSVHSTMLQAASSAAIAALSAHNHAIQDIVVAEGAVKPLVKLFKVHDLMVQIKAASALESLADHNASSQAAFLELDAPKSLMRLIKMFSMEVKEQAACALWALAGQTKTQQKAIAEIIGIPQLIEILLRDSEKLQYVGCMGMTALGREDLDSQNRIAEQGGIQPLVRLLRSHKTSERVLITVIRAIGTLCIGVAHKNNKVTQKKIAEEQAISTLVQLLISPPSVEIQVEVAFTLGCVVLGFNDNQEKLSEEPGFRFHVLLDLLNSSDDHMKLKAGFALAIFAFNNTPQQYAIREAGGIPYECLEEFLQSEDNYFKSNAAFQVVVLARVIKNQDQVYLTAKGVTTLIGILHSEDPNTLILAASLVSSLAHTRAGIPDAMVTVGAINLLLGHLSAAHDQVRFSCAVALGYLSYNRTAGRLMLTACRNTPGLYEKLQENIGKSPKICKDFTEEFRRCQIVGLPCLSLEVNGGPPIVPDRKKNNRPYTAHVRRTPMPSPVGRAVSAPVIQRAKSAGAPRLKPISPENSSYKSSKVSLDESVKFQTKQPLVLPNKTDMKFLKTSLSAWDKN